MSQIEPMRIGDSGQAIFAAYYRPTSHQRATAILLCNSVAQEANQAQRMLRVLAERLARVGRPVLRFDYRCTGDSDGACEDADVTEWKQDILAADRQLRELSGSQAVAWLGLRTGGNLALAASLEASPGPSQLLIWDALTHLGEVEGGEPLRTAPSSRSCSANHANLLFRLTPGTRELHGQPVTEKLFDQLSMLVKEQTTRSPPRSLTWLSSRPEDEPPAVLRNVIARTVSIEPWFDRKTESFVASQAISATLLNTLEAQIQVLP